MVLTLYLVLPGYLLAFVCELYITYNLSEFLEGKPQTAYAPPTMSITRASHIADTGAFHLSEIVVKLRSLPVYMVVD